MLLLVSGKLAKMVIGLSTCLIVTYCGCLCLGVELWVVGQGRQRHVHLCMVRVPNEAALYLDKLLHWVRCSCCILLQVLLLLLLLLLLGHVLLLGHSTLLLLKLKLLLLVLLLLTCQCSGCLKLLLA